MVCSFWLGSTLHTWLRIITVWLVLFCICTAHVPLQAQAADPESPPGTESQHDESKRELSWYERLRFGGDFRSRYEGFYQEGRRGGTRNRTRLRLRVKLDTEINEDTRFQLQIASGDPGTPDSTNQTFTSFFRPKPFNLDRAYLAYNPRVASAMTVGLGKFPHPQTRTQMTFDDDLNYEGGWEQIEWNLSDDVSIKLVAMQTAVNEASRGADSYMLAGYGEISFDFGVHDFQVSTANYRWGNVDQVVLGQARGELASIQTNAVVRATDGNIVGYASGFNVVDIIAQATFQTPSSTYPLRVLAEYARNTQATNDRDSGFWVEAEYGSPRQTGTWGATYTYGWIEQDVTPSAFVFSDMPGTNLRLNMIETSYVLKTGLSLDVTLHLSKRLFLPDDASNNLLTRLHVAAVMRF